MLDKLSPKEDSAHVNSELKNLTPRMVIWASQHDWFVRDNNNGTVTVRDVMYNPTTKDTTETLEVLGDIQALRDWAGY